MKRRSFLKTLGAAGLAIVTAPLYIPSERLEFGVPRPITTVPVDGPSFGANANILVARSGLDTRFILDAEGDARLWGDGVHDDRAALQTILDRDNGLYGRALPGGVYRISGPLVCRGEGATIQDLDLLSDGDSAIELLGGARHVTITCNRIERFALQGGGKV